MSVHRGLFWSKRDCASGCVRQWASESHNGGLHGTSALHLARVRHRYLILGNVVSRAVIICMQWPKSGGGREPLWVPGQGVALAPRWLPASCLSIFPPAHALLQSSRLFIYNLYSACFQECFEALAEKLFPGSSGLLSVLGCKLCTLSS